jgi:hypothetical protein
MPAPRFRTATWLVTLSVLTAATVLAEDQPPAETTEPPAATDQPTAPAADEPAAEPEPPLATAEIVFWSLTGVTGVTLITGSIFGLTALAEEERFENNPSSQARDRGEARALAADILFGVSAAAAVAAAIVLLVSDEVPAEEPAADQPQVEPTVTAGGAGITVQF